LVTPPGQRLIIGLATESPLETGLTLHHTYGVPIIPGSALKGLAAHYASQVFGELPDQQELGQRVEFTDQEGKRRVRTGTQFRTLFGDTDDAGFITFHDAWIDPASLTGDPPSLTREDEGLLLDVMTPHHGDYYGRKQYRIQGQPLPGGPRDGDFIPPTDFDNPVPVSFLSVRGKFHFVLTCVDASADGQRWLSWTADLVCAALEDWGIGGKTSSGYGRLLSPTPRHQRRAVTKMPLAQPQTVGPTERNRQRNEPVPGSMSPPAPAAPEARARTKRERVTLLAAPKNGKAKVRTEAGEEIVCERIPFHPQAHEGKQCRADVTREAGKATRGVFKSWM
jgi:CRISPR type III-B/RAMP module RAMP protein Cmr6